MKHRAKYEIAMRLLRAADARVVAVRRERDHARKYAELWKALAKAVWRNAGVSRARL